MAVIVLDSMLVLQAGMISDNTAVFGTISFSTIGPDLSNNSPVPLAVPSPAIDTAFVQINVAEFNTVAGPNTNSLFFVLSK